MLGKTISSGCEAGQRAQMSLLQAPWLVCLGWPVILLPGALCNLEQLRRHLPDHIESYRIRFSGYPGGRAPLTRERAGRHEQPGRPWSESLAVMLAQSKPIGGLNSRSHSWIGLVRAAPEEENITLLCSLRSACRDYRKRANGSASAIVYAPQDWPASLFPVDRKTQASLLEKLDDKQTN